MVLESNKGIVVLILFCLAILIIPFLFVFMVFTVEALDSSYTGDYSYEIEDEPVDDSYDNQLCSYNAFDCEDLVTQDYAQMVYEECGGLYNDVHHLDVDHDGIACDWNP